MQLASRQKMPEKPLVTPPKFGNNWQDVYGRLGMRAARTAEGLIDPACEVGICIAVASQNASLAVALLAILVLHASTKALCANYMVETGAGARTFAALSGGCLARIVACVAIGSSTSTHCAAAHMLSWAIYDLVKGKKTMNCVKAVQFVLSLTLIYAQDYNLTTDEMATVCMVRSVLGVQALCSYAARNAAYHNGDTLDDLDGFWEKMNLHSSKDAVLAIYGAPLNRFRTACVPILIMAVVSFCPETGRPVVAATVCHASHVDATLTSTARFVSFLQRFFAFMRLVHLSLWGKQIDGLSETHYLLHIAKRLSHGSKNPCVAGAFGVGGIDSAGRQAPGTSFGCKLCTAAIINDDARSRLPALLEARVGVWQTLPLLDEDVRRAAFRIYDSGLPVPGDRQVAKLIFGPPEERVVAPRW